MGVRHIWVRRVLFMWINGLAGLYRWHHLWYSPVYLYMCISFSLIHGMCVLVNCKFSTRGLEIWGFWSCSTYMGRPLWCWNLLELWVFVLLGKPLCLVNDNKRMQGPQMTETTSQMASKSQHNQMTATRPGRSCFTHLILDLLMTPREQNSGLPSLLPSMKYKKDKVEESLHS